MILALRKWWPVLLTLVLAGAAAGAFVGLRADYVVSTLFRVDASATDSTRITQSTQTAVRILDSNLVYEDAARRIGTTPLELRERVLVASVTGSELVEVRLSAPSAEEASREAAVLQRSITDAIRSLANQQFDSVVDGSDRALRSGTLPVAAAELSRLQGVGQTSAERQDAALSASQFLTTVGGLSEPRQAGLDPLRGMALGGAVGALTGLLTSVLLAGRRGTVRNATELAAFYPDQRVLHEVELVNVVNDIEKLSTPLVSILSTTDDNDHSVSFTVDDTLRTEGRSPMMIGPDDIGQSSSRSTVGTGAHQKQVDDGPALRQDRGGTSKLPTPLAPAYRHHVLSRARADVLILTATATPYLVATSAARADMTVVVVRPGVTTYREYERVAKGLGADFTTVLAQ